MRTTTRRPNQRVPSVETLLRRAERMRETTERVITSALGVHKRFHGLARIQFVEPVRPPRSLAGMHTAGGWGRLDLR